MLSKLIFWSYQKKSFFFVIFEYVSQFHAFDTDLDAAFFLLTTEKSHPFEICRMFNMNQLLLGVIFKTFHLNYS